MRCFRSAQRRNALVFLWLAARSPAAVPATVSLRAGAPCRSDRASTPFRRTSSRPSASNAIPEPPRRPACASTRRTLTRCSSASRAGKKPGILRVRAGDPDNSYLIQKLEGRAAAASECRPESRPCRRRRSTSFGRGSRRARSRARWPRHPSASLRCRRRRARRSHAARVDHRRFDRELNAPSVTTATFTLQRSGARRRSRTATRSRSRRNPSPCPRATHSRRMRSHGRQSANDTYRVTLLGTGAAAILDLGGNALDGEPLAAPFRRRPRGWRIHRARSPSRAADAAVDTDERVHAALRGLSQRRRRDLAGRHEP